MKPNFALDLPHDGIGFLHRGKGGWLLLAEISLEDPELTVQLRAMRKTAVDLESGGFTNQLIIPESQILFTTMAAPGPDDITQEARIREYLVGRCPYTVEDLVFNWQADGDMAHIAIIALYKRLNNIVFSARPHGGFGCKSYLGVIYCAGKFLRKGSKIEPDRRPIPDLMGTGASVADAPPQALPDPGPSVLQKGPPTETTPADKVNTSKPDVKVLQTETPECSKSEKAIGLEKCQNGTSTPTATQKDTTPLKAPKLAPFPPAFEPKAGGKQRYLIVPTQTPMPAPAPQKAPVAAPIAHAAATNAKATKSRRLEGAEKSQPIPPRTSKAAPEVSPSFSTHRTIAPEADIKRNSSFPIQRIEPRTLVASPSSGRDVGRPAQPQKQAHVPVTALNIVGSDAKNKSRSLKKRTADEAKRKLKDATRKEISGGLTSATGAANAASALASRNATAVPKPNKKSVSTPPSARPDADTSMAGPAPDRHPKATVNTRENSRARNRIGGTPSPTPKATEAFTIFGARVQQDVSGKPKFLALFLVLELLLLIAIFAVLAMFFLSAPSASLFPDREDQFESAITTAPNTVPGNRIAGAPYIDPGATDQFSEFDPDAPLGEDAGLSNVQPETDLLLAEFQDPVVIPEPLSPKATGTRHAATEVWERAPDPLPDPDAGRIDGLYVASIDTTTAEHDAVALPSDQLAAFENAPVDILAPPPSETRFELDERGLVHAAPQGSLTPEGVLVIAGRPNLVPAERPRGAGPEAAPLHESTQPRIRPEGLFESTERKLLGGRSRVKMAALRPTPRPQSIAALTEQAAAISKAAANTAIDDSAATAPTQLAIARSPEPKSRPKGFQKLVDAARVSDASDGSVVVTTAPRTQTVTPKTPTRASVAKQATIKNAISLRKISLIGIYGSSSNRRALVRLKSGRYVNVGVGDRLNVGKVVSISSNKLIYKKGSRSNTLQVLPFS